MSHISYVNGAYVHHYAGQVSIEDRGYQFADGVYEYIAFYNQKLLDEAPHVERLKRSLAELEIDGRHYVELLPIIMRELIRKNKRQDGAVYIQISRGTAKRDHPFPANAKANIVVVIRASKMPDMQTAMQGVKVVTHPDQRWERCDIKTIALLANVLAKQYAISHGAKEAWLYLPDKTITEGAVSNAFIVKNGKIYTHPKTHAILPGVTRDKAIKLANQLGIEVAENYFYLDDAMSADEAFLTSTSSNVQPIVSIDGRAVGDGKAGPISQKLMQAYADFIKEETGKIW